MAGTRFNGPASRASHYYHRTPRWVDHYQFTLSAGQAYVVAQPGVQNGPSPLLAQASADPNGVVAAFGRPAAATSRSPFAFRRHAGTYAVRISSDFGQTDYGLLVTRGASFDFDARRRRYRRHRPDTRLPVRTSTCSKSRRPLTLTTATPEAAGQFLNNLDPIVDLYQYGTLDSPLASNDDGAADDRNVLLNYAATPGRYLAVIRSINGIEGEYTLRVESSTPGAVVAGASFSAESEIPSGTALNHMPSPYRVLLSHDVRPDSVQASDLQINGNSATAVTIVNGRTLEFTIGSLSEGDGDYTATMADGAMTSLAAPRRPNSVPRLASTQRPQVTSTSLAEGAVRAEGSHSPRHLEDLPMVNLLSDVVLSPGFCQHAPASAGFQPTRTLTVDLLPWRRAITSYGCSAAQILPRSPEQPTDGNGDGTNGDPFCHFSVDAGTRADDAARRRARRFTDLRSAGFRYAVGDTDAFTISLDAGQKATVLTTTDATLKAHPANARTARPLSAT